MSYFFKMQRTTRKAAAILKIFAIFLLIQIKLAADLRWVSAHAQFTKAARRGMALR